MSNDRGENLTLDSMSPDEADRAFQVWAYSPSHQTLLLRSPARDGGDVNVDITFTGVTQLNIPTNLRVEAIRPEPDDDGNSQIFYLFSGEIWHSVRAATMKVARNTKPLFEGLDEDPNARAFEIAKTVEVEVFAALRRLSPEWTILRRRQGPDFEAVHSGGKMYIEVIWSPSGSVDSIVRRSVIDRVSRWKVDDLPETPLLVVTSGALADKVAEAIPAHLVTGLGTRLVWAMAWNTDSGPADLRKAVSRIWSQKT